MKTLISTLFLLFFLSIGSNAQNWALPSSRWIESDFNPWGGGYSPVYLSVGNDTIVQSQSCSAIVNDSARGVFTYTYSSGDTAYIFVNGLFKPMLYLGAHIGDTLGFYSDSNAYTTIPYLLHGKVDSIDTILISGQNLKKFNVSIIDSFPVYIYPRHFSYAEKIGFLTTYPSLFYQLFSTVVDADSYDFCNYGDSSINGFWLYPDSNCKTTVGITKVSSGPILNIYPNPASEFLYINVQLNHFGLKLYDMNGREMELVLSRDEIDIRSLSTGIYVICVTDSGNQRYFRRFIKE